MAAKTCAKYGLDTVLVERKEKPGKLLFSSGADRRVFDYIKIDKKFVDAAMYQIKQYFPDGTEISTREPEGYDMGFIFNRKMFDREILKLALKEGPEFLNKTRVIGLVRENGQIKGVKAKIDEKEDVEIRAPIVIGADGVESKVGKWAGIYDGLKFDTSLVVLDCMLEDANIEEDCIYHYYGWKNTPNIFFSLLSHGDGEVALSTQTYHSFHPKKGELLKAENYFIKTYPSLSRANVVDRGGGIMPFCPLKKFTTDGVMLVGDAARHNDNVWGKGTLRAMDAGELAGESAVEAHEEDNFSSELLSRYEERWDRLHGRRDNVAYYTLRFMMKLSNKYYNILGHSLRDNNGMITDEIYKIFSKEHRYISKLIFELEKEGIANTDQFFSYTSPFGEYFRNFWDTFVE